MEPLMKLRLLARFADCITVVTAYDPDIGDIHADQKIMYFIVNDDQQKLINIDKTGCMTLKKPLDRDPPMGYPMWSVSILLQLRLHHLGQFFRTPFKELFRHFDIYRRH